MFNGAAKMQDTTTEIELLRASLAFTTKTRGVTYALRYTIACEARMHRDLGSFLIEADSASPDSSAFHK